MTSLETHYPTTAGPENTITREAQEHNLKSEVMKMIAVLEEKNKPIKEI